MNSPSIGTVDAPRADNNGFDERASPVGDPAPLVCAIVLNWNNLAATSACIQSLTDTGYPRLRIIVVDNASTDGSAEALAAAPGIEFVSNRANLGFTGGVNAGIARAMASLADYVWLLNSDATAEPDVLRMLVATAERDARIGLVSPVFHHPEHPDNKEFCLGILDPDSCVLRQTADPETARIWCENYPGQIVLLGTALLIRRAVLESLGGLDDRFFAYVEDVDYSLRAHQAGFNVVAVPNAIAYHAFKTPITDPGRCPPYLHYYMSRNYLLLWRKLPDFTFRRKATVWFLRERLAQLARIKHDRLATEALLSGLWDGVRGVGGPYVAARRMPGMLRWLLRCNPRLLIRLMDCLRRPAHSRAA